MIIVKASTTAKEGKREALKAVAMNCVMETRKEAGCISYEFLLSAEDQVSGMFVEVWESQEALNLHMKTPHFQSFIEKSQEYLENEISIKLFQAEEVK